MGEGDVTSAGIESEVEVVEGELESAENGNPLEARIVVSCTMHSPSTASRPHKLRTGTVSLNAEKSYMYFDK